MGKIVRQGEVIPVQARRVGGAVPPVPPTTAYAPGMEPVDPLPPAAGGPQNVIYVVAPQSPPPPAEVHHHHHHTTEVVMPVRRRRRSKGTSFLGTLGFVVGGLACLTAFAQQVAVAAPYIAIGGLVAATLGWCGAVLFRRVGATMPFVGMVVSTAGYGLGLFMTGQAQSTYDGLRSRSPVPLPAVRFPAGPATSQPAVVEGTPAAGSVKVTPPPVRRQPRVGEGTIFDPLSGGWVKPPTTRP